VLFYVDAIIFPTLPELFTVIIFVAGRSTVPDLLLAVLILAVIAMAEFSGLSTLYFIIKKVRVPNAIKKAADRYSCFLFVSDERIILINRLAPVLPFIGAFVAILNWSYRKAVIYTFAGGMIKYGVILALASWFFAYLGQGTGMQVTLFMVLAILAISFALSYYRRRQMRRKNADRTC